MIKGGNKKKTVKDKVVSESTDKNEALGAAYKYEEVTKNGKTTLYQVRTSFRHAEKSKDISAIKTQRLSEIEETSGRRRSKGISS